jgi:hypothetical protein
VGQAAGGGAAEPADAGCRGRLGLQPAADLLLLGGLFAALLAYADDILRHSPRLVVVVILGLASFLITEALTGLRLQTAVFEYLKIVTPALLSLVLMRLYARDAALVLQLCRITLTLVWCLACFALVFLPASLNRGGEKFWPVYFASLHTASYLMVVCAACRSISSRLASWGAAC